MCDASLGRVEEGRGSDRGVRRVLIVAGSPLVRASLQRMLNDGRAEVVGSLSDLDSACAQLAELEPQVVLMEAPAGAEEEWLDGLADTEIARDFAVMILCDQENVAWHARAFRDGVRAVLPSDILPEQLRAALEAVATGLVVVPLAELRTFLPATSNPSRQVEELLEPLTPREQEVLQMLSAGLANKEIAAKLRISDHTVKFHVASILGKLGVSTRTEAVIAGIRRGLVML